jgi:hypothetical protein
MSLLSLRAFVVCKKGETYQEEAEADLFYPLTPELNPSSQRCLPRFFTGDFNF